MKAKDIKELDPTEIRQKIKDLGQEIFNLRVQGKTGQLEKVGKIREKKRDIARMHTVLNELTRKETEEATAKVASK